jgi:iron complex transport system permease protein
MPVTLKKVLVISVSLSLFLLAVALFSLSIGSAEIGFIRILSIILSKLPFFHSVPFDETEVAIVISIRLPRILLAALVGAALSIAGVVFQGLLRNPLAEPYILGISNGSAVGAILAIMAGIMASSWVFPLTSFGGALLTILLVYRIARVDKRMETNTLLLVGVIVGFFFAAIVMFLLSISPTHGLHKAFFWLMGDLSTANYLKIIIILPYVLGGTVFIYAWARSLNIISMGEEAALQLGIEVEKAKLTLFVAASLITGAVVAVGGVIGFVGLIIPHIVRLLAGPDHRLLLPASALVGATFLIIADTLARIIIPPSELPVGVVTAFFGAPFFIYLLRRKRQEVFDEQNL